MKASSSSRAPAGSKVRRDKRVAILDAAVRVFARMGYHGARVSDIAREAGIAYGLVYHYFKNKEEILNTIFEERWGGFVEVVEGIGEQPGRAEDKLVSLVAVILNAYRLRPDWVKVLVLEIQRSSRFSEPGQIRAVGRLFQAVTRILRAGQASGELRDDLDPEVACYVLVGALDIALSALVLDVVDLDARGQKLDDWCLEVARTVVEIFVRGFGAAKGEA